MDRLPPRHSPRPDLRNRREAAARDDSGQERHGQLTPVEVIYLRGRFMYFLRMDSAAVRVSPEALAFLSSGLATCPLPPASASFAAASLAFRAAKSSTVLPSGTLSSARGPLVSVSS